MDIKLTYQQRKYVAKEIKQVILPLQSSKESFEKLVKQLEELPEHPTNEQCEIFSQSFLDAIRSSLAVDTAFKETMNMIALLGLDDKNRN